MCAVLAPLSENYHVDMVLQGHDHVYARAHKVAEDPNVDPSAPAGSAYREASVNPLQYS